MTEEKKGKLTITIDKKVVQKEAPVPMPISRTPKKEEGG